MSEGNHIVVIGGGASGMVAAISARRAGAYVTILERNPRVGKKILATGNGRCNFTNINADISHYYGKNPKFAYGALANFPVERTIDFFEGLGIAHKVEDMGKVFPMSDQASSVLDVLRYELLSLGVEVVCDSYVRQVTKRDARFIIALDNKKRYTADRVIMATGGKAMPSSGSDGNGYDLARSLGHRETKFFPALVQLKLDGNYFNRINGVKFVGTAEVLFNNESLAKDRGDILFANYGVSGPPILQISRVAGELLSRGKMPILKIALVDTMPGNDLRYFLEKRLRAGANKPIDFNFIGFINKRLIPVVLQEAGITNFKRKASSLSSEEKGKIVDLLTGWRFKIKGTKGWQSAQVTAGGVDTSEINPKTMESKLVKGLFYAGEILDIDGQCGGFNLQWAWSSGYISGQEAAL